MKKLIRKPMVRMMGIALAGLLIFCASSGAQTKGFIDGYYDKLQPGPEGWAKMRWIKEGADFSKYNKIMLDSVVFYFAEDSENKGIDAEEMKTLSDICNKAFVTVLKDAYPIVAEPGPDVLRLRYAITDLKKNKPALSAVTSVVPVGVGFNLIKKGTTGTWSGSGATKAEYMAIDSTTDEVLIACQDELSAGFTERFTEWGSADAAFEVWAKRVKDFLDQAHKVRP